MREFQSIFATEIISYINRIRESGRTTACHEVHLGSLDRYLSIIGLPEKEINETTAVGWLKYRNAKPNYQAKYSLQGTTQSNGLTGGVPPVRFSM